MFDLNGKNALVTGASGGIGSAVAKALASRGATVVLTGRRQEALEAVAAEIGGSAHVVVADLGTAEGADALMAQAAEAVGGSIDILVNNAGLTRDGLSMRMKDEDIDAVLEVNTKAAFRLMRAAMRAMTKSRWGRIVNITSVVGLVGNPGQANYAASKGALTAMSKSVASELATRGVTVNCVAPGFVATAMTDVLSDKQKEIVDSSVPMGRMGTPEEIAAAVTFLASPEASYLTGQTISVNGGMVML